MNLVKAKKVQQSDGFVELKDTLYYKSLWEICESGELFTSLEDASQDPIPVNAYRYAYYSTKGQNWYLETDLIPPQPKQV